MHDTMSDPAEHGEVLRDRLGRRLESLRVSVTDRCNLRCRYCMPEDQYVWLPRDSILRFEEISRLVGVFATLGVHRIRLTGGEPLLRRDLADLVAQLRAHRPLDDIAMTTNGLLLAAHAVSLRAAGLDRVTVSLDTLRADRFRAFTRRARLDQVLGGIEATRAAGFRSTKVNTVVVRGFNDDEVIDLLEYSRQAGVEVRFIEYMDVGGATRWSWESVVSRTELLGRIERHYGEVDPLDHPRDCGAPAERFRLPDGTRFGVIASTTAPFCRSCGRSRLTADGDWLLSLYADHGIQLRDQLRAGASDEALAAIIAEAWRGRTDRGAEQRLAARARGPLFHVESLRQDPHREMHTRGG